MNDEKTDQKTTSFSADDTNDEFKVFRTIENTFIGIYTFIVWYLYTSWIIIIHPARLHTQLFKTKSGHTISRSFIYLLISIFLCGLALRNLQPLFNPISGIRQELESINTSSLLTTAFPVFAIVILIGLMLAHVLARSSNTQKHQVLELFSYGTGVQFLLYTLLISLIFFLLDLHNVVDVILPIITLPVVLYLLVLPGLVIFLSLRKTQWKDKSRSYCVATIISLIVFDIIKFYIASYAAFFASSLDVLEVIEADNRPIPVKCESSTIKLNKTNRLSLTLIITNISKKTVFLKRDNLILQKLDWIPILNIGRRKPITNMGSNSIHTLVVDWQAAKQPILPLSPGESKWLSIEIQENHINESPNWIHSTSNYSYLFTLPTVRGINLQCVSESHK